MAELLVLLSSRKQTFGERRLDEGTRGRYVGVLYLGRARALPSDDFDDWEKRAWAKRSSVRLVRELEARSAVGRLSLRVVSPNERRRTLTLVVKKWRARSRRGGGFGRGRGVGCRIRCKRWSTGGGDRSVAGTPAGRSSLLERRSRRARHEGFLRNRSPSYPSAERGWRRHPSAAAVTKRSHLLQGPAIDDRRDFVLDRRAQGRAWHNPSSRRRASPRRYRCWWAARRGSLESEERSLSRRRRRASGLRGMGRVGVLGRRRASTASGTKIMRDGRWVVGWELGDLEEGIGDAVETLGRRRIGEEIAVKEMMANRERDAREMVEEDGDVSIVGSFRRFETRLEMRADGKRKESVEKAGKRGQDRISSDQNRIRDSREGSKLTSKAQLHPSKLARTPSFLSLLRYCYFLPTCSSTSSPACSAPSAGSLPPPNPLPVTPSTPGSMVSRAP
jgi:hypothetical protein